MGAAEAVSWAEYFSARPWTEREAWLAWAIYEASPNRSKKDRKRKFKDFMPPRLKPRKPMSPEEFIARFEALAK